MNGEDRLRDLEEGPVGGDLWYGLKMYIIYLIFTIILRSRYFSFHSQFIKEKIINADRVILLIIEKGYNKSSYYIKNTDL